MVNDTEPKASAGGVAPPRRGLAVVYLTVIVDLLGFGIILPLLPFYARSFGASGLWVGVLMTAYSAAQFVGAPVLGRLSDLYGRRPLLLVALAGSAASLTVAGAATSLPVLIAARALAGLFGGSIAAAQAYVADVTTPAERSKYMGILGASIGMGFVFGPAIGAGLSRFGFGTAAFVAAGIALLNLVAAAFRLEETRPAAGAESGRRLRFAGLGAALHDSGIRPLLLASFLLTLGFVGMETTYALLGAARFGLTAAGLGYVFTYIGVVVALVQGGLVGRLAPRLGEQPLALAGFVIMTFGLALVGWAGSLPASVAALGLVAAGQALTQPTLATMLSRCAGLDDQGGVLGLGQSFAALARATGPVLAG
jgi:DHA1 family tetracycline resistance protein-like MFS transporter